MKLSTNHPEAKIIAHPECPESLLAHAHHVGSTSSLLKFVEDRPGGEFIILTEAGIIHQMRQKNPTGKFYDCPFVDAAGCTLCNTCPYMKLNNLEKLYLVMKYGSDSVNGGELDLSEELRIRAEKPLRKMLEMSEVKKEKKDDDEDDDQNFIKKGEEEQENTEEKVEEKKTAKSVASGKEVGGILKKLKNYILPQSNQQRSLNNEVGGLEAKEAKAASGDDVWDERSEEVDGMATDVFNSTGMKSVVVKLKKKRLQEKEEMIVESMEAAQHAKDAAGKAANQQQGSFAARVQQNNGQSNGGGMGR